MTTITIDVGNKCGVDLQVTHVGKNLYRVDEEAALFLGAESDEEAESFPRYGDIIQVARIDADLFKFERVFERSFIHHIFMIPRKDISSPIFKKVLESIADNGGYWERHMGGVLLVSMPKTSKYLPAEALRFL